MYQRFFRLIMKEKITFLTELKKYSKIGCLLLVLGVVSFSAEAQTRIIDLTSYMQNNPNWGGDRYGNQSAGWYIGYMKGKGCALTCVSMLSSAKGNNTTPGTLNSWARTNNKFSGSADVDWQPFANYGFSGGITAKATAAFSIKRIRDEIDNGNPVIINVDGSAACKHFVIIYGYENGGTQISEFFIYDPAPVNNKRHPGISVRTKLNQCDICPGYPLRPFNDVNGTTTGQHDVDGPMTIAVTNSKVIKYDTKGDYYYYEQRFCVCSCHRPSRS